MTTPDLSSIVPLKYKTYVGLIGSVLTFVVPLVLSVQDYLPSPWPAVIGGVLSVLTALGIYKAPYKPAGTVLAPEPLPAALPGVGAGGGSATVQTAWVPKSSMGAEYKNPWQS